MLFLAAVGGERLWPKIAATSKKIGANLFSPGDKYFLSGDLLKQDAWGFYFWHDRIGDTFRWKGENVSTAEVSCVLSQVLGEQLADVNVYGVLVRVFESGSNKSKAIFVVSRYLSSLANTH